MNISVLDIATIEAITYNVYGVGIGVYENMVSADFYRDRDVEPRAMADRFAREGIVYSDEMD